MDEWLEELPENVRTPREARAWIRERYLAQGFTVTDDPAAGELPDSLADFHMDLLAGRGSERVAIVVRRRNDLSDNTSGLAALLATMPDWRFDLIVLPSSTIEVARNLPASDLAKAP